MARVTVEDCLKHASNRFVLIHAAVKRATQLKKGATPLVESPGEKNTVLALREIAQGYVKIIDKNQSLNQLPPEGSL